MRVAIVGCGQLSRMLALAGLAMGIRFSFIAEAGEETVCVDGLGTIVIWKSGDDVKQLYNKLGQPNCVTIEKEQVDITLLNALNHYCSVYPSLKAISACQHRHLEKKLLEKIDIPCAEYIYLDTNDNLSTEKFSQIPLPLIAKSCKEGYDGKNQWSLNSQQDIENFKRSSLGDEWIIEKKINFKKEVSQISVRSTSGEIAHYSLTENTHNNGILYHSIAPAKAIPKHLTIKVQHYISQIMDALNYVGVMAMECFVLKDQLLINELAPRVHNSGHWTQLGSITCQFENHLRAITGLALGSTTQHNVAGMVNLLGSAAPPLESLSACSAVHWYNKTTKPHRKQGHVNFINDNYANLDEKIEQFSRMQSMQT